MPLTREKVRDIREAILAVCMVYFYGIALAMKFGWPTFGLERLQVLLSMGAIFLFILVQEALINWTSKRALIVRAGALVVSYGFIGLYIVPNMYGSWVIPYVLFVPLGIFFVVGFVYACVKVLLEAFSKHT